MLTLGKGNPYASPRGVSQVMRVQIVNAECTTAMQLFSDSAKGIFARALEDMMGNVCGHSREGPTLFQGEERRMRSSNTASVFS
jgi:hypothetical protein